MMDEYVPKDVTEKAKEIANLDENKREFSLNDKFPQLLFRIGYAKPIAYSKRKSIQEVIK